MEATADPIGAVPWSKLAARFLGRAEGALGSMAWPLLLMRGFPFDLIEPPPGAIETYRRTWWSEFPSDRPFDVAAELAWVSTDGASTEVAVSSRATMDGVELAGNVVVLRVGASGIPPRGERRIPRAPEVPGLERGDRFLLDPDRVRQLEALLGRGSPVTDSDVFAHGQGFPSALTPSLVLLHRAFDREHGWTEQGTVEMWLPRPVPRGAVTEVCRSQVEPSLAVLRVIGQEAPAAVCRLRSFAEPL